MEQKKEKKVGGKEIFKGRLLDLFVDDVELPNGHKSTREIIRHCKASAILAFDQDGSLILEDQYRYPFDETITEIPAGKCDKDEDPADCAKRELEEETGYKAMHLEYLGKIYPSVAYTDEIIYIYMATGLVKGERKLDDDESLDYYKVSFEKFSDMIRKGVLVDAKTVAAYSFYVSKYKKFRKEIKL